MSNAPAPSPALGADIDLRSNDIQWSSGGDIAMVAGLGVVQQRLFLRAITTPGTLLNHADFGMGLAAQVEEPLTDEAQATLTALISDQCALDPAVASVESVTLTQPQIGTLQIQVQVTLVGGTPATIPIVVTGH